MEQKRVVPARDVGEIRRSRAVRVYGSAAMVWLILAGAATAAGIVRETWFVPLLGELRAHQFGTLAVCALFLAIIAVFVRRVRPSARQALRIGAAWLLLALAFEFGVGRYVDGLSWQRLLADYDLSRGRLLLLLWGTVAAGPFVLTRLLDRRRSPR